MISIYTTQHERIEDMSSWFLGFDSDANWKLASINNRKSADAICMVKGMSVEQVLKSLKFTYDFKCAQVLAATGHAGVEQAA